MFRCLKLYALKNAHNWLVTPAFRASQVALVVKNLPASAGDVRDSGLIPGLGRSPGGGNGNPLQYSCLENPMDRGAWQATVHRVAKSRTQLSTHACVHLGAGTVVGVKTHPIPSLETLLGQRLRWEVLQ